MVELKRLFKFDKKEWIWVFIAILFIGLALMYKRDVGICQKVLEDPCEYADCDTYCMGKESSIIKEFNYSFQKEVEYGNTKKENTGYVSSFL